MHATLVLPRRHTGYRARAAAAYLTWSVFSALIIVGIVTALQASRISRLGAGHLVVMGVTPNYIPLSVLALDEGGPAMLASLMVVSALFFFAIATRLPQLRRVITPTVSGTVLMLIAVMVLPICLDRFGEVPDGVPTETGGRCSLGVIYGIWDQSFSEI